MDCSHHQDKLPHQQSLVSAVSPDQNVEQSVESEVLLVVLTVDVDAAFHHSLYHQLSDDHFNTSD